jgi:hypothetical protein
MTGRRCLIGALPLLVGAVFGLGWVQAQIADAQEAEVTLILLGPVGDWLYPRAFEDLSEEAASLRENYLDSLDSLRQSIPSPTVIAAHWLAPPVMQYETSFGGDPQRFVSEAGVDVVIPAPEDLAHGDRRLHRLPEAFDVPVLATDLALPRHPEANLARSVPLMRNGVASSKLLASVDPTVILCVDALANEAVRDPELLETEIAAEELPAIVLDTAAATWKGTEPTEASRRSGALTLPLPTLEGHQVAIWRVTELSGEPGASLEIVDLIAPDVSPLLRQPATVSLTVGTSIPRRALSHLVAGLFEHDEAIEDRRPARAVEDLAPRVTNETVYTYSLYRERVLTHRLYGVHAQPGSLHSDFRAAIVTDAETEAISLLWRQRPAVGGRGVNLDRVIESMLDEHGLEGFPAGPPEATGLEIQYAAAREALAASALLQRSLEDLP